jgi:hypothetical protein
VRSDPLSFFTVDHGTASTAAALVAPHGGRFRLLAATAGPRGIPVDGLLEDLVRRVVAVTPEVLPDADGWSSWARLEVGTHRPPRVVVAATTERIADVLSHTFRTAGWDVAGRIVAGRSDPLAITRACLDHATTVVALGAAEPPGSDERHLLDELAAAMGAVAHRRPGLSVLLCGGAVAVAGAFPADRTAPVAGPVNGPTAAGSALHESALTLAAEHAASDRASLPDGRRALAVGAASLASLLERPIDVIDVGHSAGTRVVASPEGATELVVDADAALISRRAMEADAEVDAILRWSAMRAEPLGMRDRLRNLRLEPWRGMAGDGARLRLAALRAALARLGTGRAQRASDLVVCAGGAFAAVPPPLAALATLDAVRRPGALSIVWDHARLLAPIGTLSSTSDRRRLLAELLDDAFLPLAGAIVASEPRPRRHPVLLRLASSVLSTEVWLEPGALRTVDLPPGVVARADITARDPILVGVKGRHIVMDVTGGLGGLLIDTREVPLRLPDRAERRRALLESWERPLWPAVA